MAKKIIVITVDEEIAQEMQEQVKNFIHDFYGETEEARIQVGEVTDASETSA